MQKIKKILLPFLYFGLLFPFPSLYAQNSNREKQLLVALRNLGHLILLQNNDSITVVPPIKQNNNTYTIQFNIPIEITPDSLTKTIHKTLPPHFVSHYIVNVVSCNSKEIVYSYEFKNDFQESTIPCTFRTLPKNAYELSIHILSTFKEKKETNDSISQGSLNKILQILLLLALVFVFFKIKKQKKKNPKEKESQQISIGNYRLDPITMQLHHTETSYELSQKEISLLLLLWENLNNPINREEILKQVWENEGEYMGRTLDVYISKLRKKLEKDPSLKIINLRGIGYKMIQEL